MANPGLPTSPLRKDPNGVGETWAKAYITTQTTTLLKTGAGVLHSVTINKPVATGTIELDDAITNTNPFAIITTPTGPFPLTLIYDVEFTTGLSVTTGTASQDITISFS
jgi:hypothetical protein